MKMDQTKDETAGSLDAFEMIVQPNARMPVAHFHESWDETIYGLTGASTWHVDGRDVVLKSVRSLSSMPPSRIVSDVT